jgi:hypothetical protein
MQRYRHSGIVPLSGAIKTLVFGCAAALVLGFINAYAVAWVPFIYLNFLFTLLFGGAVGMGVNLGIRSGKVRSGWFAGLAALLCMTVGLYVYWGASIWALGGQRIGLRAWSPLVIVELVNALFENGSWGLSDNAPVKGWPLVAVWVVEAGVLYFIAWATALSALMQPFCERCRAWTSMQQGIVRFAGNGGESVWQRIADGDLPALGEVTVLADEPPRFVRLDMARCPHCAESNFLTLKAVELTTDNEGKVKTKERSIVEHAILSSAQVEIIGHLQAEAAALAEATSDELPDEPDGIEETSPDQPNPSPS